MTRERGKPASGRALPVLTIVDVLMVLVARGEMLATSAWTTYVGLVGDDKEENMLVCRDELQWGHDLSIVETALAPTIISQKTSRMQDYGCG